MSAPAANSIVFYTIGHGNRSVSDFVGQLRTAGVACLIDVRAYPASRRHPQFTRLALEPALRGEGIRYLWEGAGLGGMRSVKAGSPHTALKDPVLRAYADHMSTAGFMESMARLISVGRTQTAAFMCAERDPLHCHRSFIADALTVRGLTVLHLHDEGDVRLHTLRPEARVADGAEIVYDSGVQFGLTF